MSYRQCFCCKQKVKVEDNGILYGAGFAYISFHYGSTLDQMHGWQRHGITADPLDQILEHNTIEAIICDGCFRERHMLCVGRNES